MSVEQHTFKAEVKELLDLMIHSLYSHKEVFLRELISNASDAVDKARYLSLTDSSIMEGASQWGIRIAADKNLNTLTISDNGIGMTKEEVVEALGTIARSGTREFLAALKDKDATSRPDLIGQFGVGFYSSFMVADKVTVLTRKSGRGGEPAVKWESAADGSFAVEEVEKEGAGTDVTLHLREEDRKYLDEWEIKSIVKKYSDYIEYPIVMEVEREKESEIEKGTRVKVREDETLNSQKAIWLKDKSDITEEEYHQFYRHISHDFGDPAKVVHYKAEGTSEFIALLYIPSKAPLGILFKDFKIGPALYVRRVQIMDHCEDLLPAYLRFVRGVVDSSDLPLNVSREMLQTNRQVEIMRKNITKKILDVLAEMKKNDYEKYVTFYKEFGKVLKEGIHYDYSRREQIADLLLFASTKTAARDFTTLQSYVDSMKPDQKDIYYITAATTDEIARSPYLEVFREKDYEVLVMPDEIDDIIIASLGEYKGKKLKSVVKGDVDLDGREKEAGGKLDELLAMMSEILKDEVKEVRLSGRLKDSPCCLVREEGAMDPAMERMLQAMGQEVPASKGILEINAAHPLFADLDAVKKSADGQALIRDYATLLYGQALLLEGSKPKDPAAFAQLLSKLMIDGTRALSAEQRSKGD